LIISWPSRCIAPRRRWNSFELVLGDLQLFGKGFGVDRTAGLGQQLQDVFAAGQRRFVAFDFTLVERIGEADRRDLVFAGAAAGLFCSSLTI
jgi:hypothetical protein